MNMQHLLGKRIREIREQRGISQEELAFLANTQPSHISRIELGQNNTSVDVVYRIAQGLQIRLCDLLDFDTSEIELSSCDEHILKVIAYMNAVSERDREQIEKIVRTFVK